MTGDWMITRSGAWKEFGRADAFDISIWDIAHSLSKIDRFNGHGRFMYSVAQHSVYCAEQVEFFYAFDALMHDAHEALCGDMNGNLKNHMQDFRQFEDECQNFMALNYELRSPVPNKVKEIDGSMLVTEISQLFDGPPRRPKGFEDARILAVEIQEMEWRKARQLFMDKFNSLCPSHLAAVETPEWWDH